MLERCRKTYEERGKGLTSTPRTHREKPYARTSSQSVSLVVVVGAWVTHEMPLAANSVTNMPPPLAAKPGPYDVVLGFVMIQPSLLLAKMEQSVELIRVLVCTEELESMHPYMPLISEGYMDGSYSVHDVLDPYATPCAP